MSARNLIRFSGIVMVCIFFASTGCSKRQKALASIKEGFANHNHQEVIVLCEHAIRNDIRDSEIYLYYGLSLLELDRDFESLRQLRQAARMDTTLKEHIAGALVEKGKSALRSGGTKRVASRLMAASNFYPDVELGRFEYMVADAYLQKREFQRAADLYGSALVAHPDTSVAEQAYFNLSECRLSLGDSTGAVEALEELMEAFPRGGIVSRARFKLVNLLYGMAEAEFLRGNYETVVENVATLLKRTDNVSLRQRARFLLGEAHERMEDYRKAYEQYRAIIDEDQGASGRIVERARQKIEAFRDSGLL